VVVSWKIEDFLLLYRLKERLTDFFLKTKFFWRTNKTHARALLALLQFPLSMYVSIRQFWRKHLTLCTLCEGISNQVFVITILAGYRMVAFRKKSDSWRTIKKD
jgi:hypothetical protein